MKLSEILDKPFPLIDNIRHLFVVAFLFASFVFLFLIVFQPFGIREITFYKPLFVLGYSVITFCVMFLTSAGFSLFFSSSYVDSWKVKNVLIFSCIMIVLISVGNWLYTITIGKDIMVQYSLPSFVFITLAVGIFPVVFIILLAEKILFKKKVNLSSKLSADFSTSNPSHSGLHQKIILGEDRNSFSVDLSQILCVKSDGNYIEIFTLSETTVKKHLFRYSLSKLKEQLAEYPHFQRCHRSFIVNKYFIDNISGNARNFNLHINALDFSIPVSRKFPVESLKN